jgi:hypothetical protein
MPNALRLCVAFSCVFAVFLPKAPRRIAVLNLSFCRRTMATCALAVRVKELPRLAVISY